MRVRVRVRVRARARARVLVQRTSGERSAVTSVTSAEKLGDYLVRVRVRVRVRVKG